MCNENLDLVQLLGNCPKGTKLYSPIAGEVSFIGINKESTDNYPIKCEFGTKNIGILFTSDGHYFSKQEADGECVLFPSKNCRDWSKFELFKDGDIVVSYDVRPFILKGSTDGKFPLAYGGVNSRCEFIP